MELADLQNLQTNATSEAQNNPRLDRKSSRLFTTTAQQEELIKSFIARVNKVDDVDNGWREYVSVEKEKELAAIIAEENLKEKEARKFINNTFRDGTFKTTGSDIDKILPPVSRFGDGNRAEKKQTVIEKLLVFFEKFFGVA